MVAAGPFIFSGLVEAILDHRVIHNLLNNHIPRGRDCGRNLNRKERVEFLTAIVAGNLAIKGVPADPQEEMRNVLDVEGHPEQVEVQLRAMLACQYPFGAGVGGPILFYIGSFAYTLALLQNDTGNHDTARALAFGIWWMNIVHVAAISGLLLASNNPSTAAAIVGRRRERLTYQERLGLAESLTELEDNIQARVEAWSRFPLAYKARYEPVWMWNRGKNKMRWLQRTSAWNNHEWFRDRVEMTLQGWVALTLGTYFLIFFPCSLAFWIEYNTPPQGPGCRSMTILSYACAQFTFVVLSAWSHFKASHTDGDYWNQHRWLNRLRREWVGYTVALLFLLPALVVAVFVTFAGTLMQITGIYQNCFCASTGFWSFAEGSIVTLSTDTAYDRKTSWSWKRAGYTALGFLACVTYLGWWGQRYLREKFIDRVKHLVEDETQGHAQGGIPVLLGLQRPVTLDNTDPTLRQPVPGQQGVNTYDPSGESLVSIQSQPKDR